jgi:hypothetical protein
MLYSKNGSIPKPETDGTEGWLEVPDMPEAPEGKEVVWWFPPGWVIRDPKPAEREGYKWSWSQSEEKWIEYQLPNAVVGEAPVVELPTDPLPTLTSADVVALTSEQIGVL